MKLSNKVLIGFFGFIFIYMTAAFTEIRFKGDLRYIDDSNGTMESVDITGIKYLILPSSDERISIIGSDQSKIEVYSVSGDLLKNLKYTLKNDTLTLMPLDLAKNQHVKLSIYISENIFSGMTVNNTEVIIEEIEQKSLSVSQTGGWIKMSNNKLDKLIIKASQEAHFTLIDSELDTFSVFSNHSEIMIRSSIKRVEGRITNDSYLQIRNVDEIEFKKDESSTIRF